MKSLVERMPKSIARIGLFLLIVFLAAACSLWPSPNRVVLDTFTEYDLPTQSSVFVLTTGPDGNLWFTEEGANKIGRITPSGQITEFALSTLGDNAHGITTGPDGNLGL